MRKKYLRIRGFGCKRNIHGSADLYAKEILMDPSADSDAKEMLTDPRIRMRQKYLRISTGTVQVRSYRTLVVYKSFRKFFSYQYRYQNMQNFMQNSN